MGLTDVRVRVGNPGDSTKTADLDFLVDSGAVYTVVPRPVLDTLNITPHSERDFILANVALAVLLQRDGVQSSTVPIRFRVRYGGQPSVPSLRAFASLGLRTVAQLRRLI